MYYLNKLPALFSKPFNPLDYSPLWWLDFSDTSTITEASGLVSAVADKSGNGHNVSQSTGANRPYTGTSNINGRNVLSFPSSQSRWLTIPSSLYSATNGNYTLLILSNNRGSTSNDDFIFGMDNGTGSPRLGMQYWFFGPYIRHWAGPDSGAGVLDISASRSDNNVNVIVKNGGNMNAWVNGSKDPSTKTGTSFTATRGNIGIWADGSFGNYEGDIGTVFMLPFAASDSLVSELVTGFNGLWGI